MLRTCLHSSNSKKMAEDTKAKNKVIIIGAGISGLSAAQQLYEFGFSDIHIYEAQDRIGGRIHTLPFGAGIVELGASWLHGEVGNILYDLAKEKGLINDPKESHGIEGDGRFYTDMGQLMNYSHVKEIIGFMEDVKEQLHHGKLGMNSDTLSVGQVYEQKFVSFMSSGEASIKDPRLLLSIYEWYMRFENIDNASNNMNEVSIKSYSEWVECPGIPLINFKSGFQCVIDLILNYLPPNILHLNSPVESINYDENEFWPFGYPQVCVNLENGDTVKANHVIVTSSVGFLKHNMGNFFIPPLESKKATAILNAGFGTINKIYLRFEKPFWDPNEIGFQLIWTRKDHPLLPKWAYCISGFDLVKNQETNTLMCWIGGEGAKELETVNPQTVEEVCVKILRMFLTDKIIPNPVEISISRWWSNQYIRGAYSFKSINSDFAKTSLEDYIEPIKREVIVNQKKMNWPLVLFAGEATHPEYYSTTHGALLSGLREAQRLVDFVSEI